MNKQQHTLSTNLQEGVKARAKSISAFPKDIVDALNSYLLSGMPTQEFMAVCGLFMFAGEDMGESVKECSAILQPTVCTQVWAEGSFFYRCRNCEMSSAR